jgi:hypothetical protein
VPERKIDACCGLTERIIKNGRQKKCLPISVTALSFFVSLSAEGFLRWTFRETSMTIFATNEQDSNDAISLSYLRKRTILMR